MSRDPAVTELAARSRPAGWLPYHAAKLLQNAALTPVSVFDPLARVKAIDKATEQVKRQYPQFFKE